MTDERSKQQPGVEDDTSATEEPSLAPINPFASARPPGRISLDIPKPARPSTAPLPSFAKLSGSQEPDPPTLDDLDGAPEGLEEDSGDLPTGNLSPDAIPGLEHMRIGASSSWDDDTLGESEAPPLAMPPLAAEEPEDDFEGEHTVALDPHFDDGLSPPVGLSTYTDVEEIDEIADGDLVVLADDDNDDPTTNIPAEDVEQALRASGAFDVVPRPAASEPAPAPAPTHTPGPAPSPDPSRNRHRTQLGLGAVRGPDPVQSPARTPDAPIDFTEEVAAPLDLAQGPGFEVQATEILDSVFESEAVAPKLVLTQGPASGQEYFARELRVTVGRGENNTIQLPDPALSRTHFEICKNPDESFTLRDLESANGTYLNGQRIKEASLFDGDSVEIGKSVAIFRCATAPPRSYRHLIPAATETIAGALPPLDEHTRLDALEFDKSTRLFTRITLAAGAIALLFIVALIALLATRDPKPAAPAASPTVQLDATKVEAQRLYLLGVEAVKTRDWGAARVNFEAAHAADDSLEITPQLTRIESESTSEKLLGEARALAAKADLDAARDIAAKIPSSSSYYDEASALVRTKKGVELSSLYEQAQAQFTADDLDTSLTTLDAILEREPDHAGAKSLRPRVLERQAALARQAEIAAAAAARDTTPSVAPDPFASPTRKTNPITASGGLDEGMALYRKKKFGDAARFFSRSGDPKGKDLASAVRTLDSAWASGRSLSKKKSWTKARKELERARAADRRIKGSHRSALNGALAEIHAERGLERLRAKKYKEARRALIDGEKLSKSHAKVKDLKRALERVATSLYIQAANKKKTNPKAAGEICRTIMRMVPSSSPSWQKAKKLLLEL